MIIDDILPDRAACPGQSACHFSKSPDCRLLIAQQFTQECQIIVDRLSHLAQSQPIPDTHPTHAAGA
jgi:hypothetical protein